MHEYLYEDEDHAEENSENNVKWKNYLFTLKMLSPSLYEYMNIYIELKTILNALFRLPCINLIPFLVALKLLTFNCNFQYYVVIFLGR